MNQIKQAQRQAAHDTVVAALAQAHGRIPDAAKIIGCTPANLRVWIHRLNLNARDHRL